MSDLTLVPLMSRAISSKHFDRGVRSETFVSSQLKQSVSRRERELRGDRSVTAVSSRSRSLR